MNFTNTGFQAELIASKQFNGELVTDLTMQYADIDLIIRGKTVSVKDQSWSSGKYGSIQVELNLHNTDTGDTSPGCFQKCKADYCMWRITHQCKEQWLCISTAVLKQYVAETQLRRWWTSQSVEAKNRQQGRYYNGASGYNIPLDAAVKLGKLTPVRSADV